ncbi:hypothetical protein [Mesorhizobium onobrychidis]|uniref:Uncharacterized protein n=1 Tax=Mesorhizobium onobrychidis TaxID=2775404 RepID=A0ABY5QSY3_9HYPH|nr:hypothetical protein [Mesorhizobium onobrychidis]UVC14285.1 hypothetical protein IHQ72_27070 [Mesorhizobium onobrychidis]
MTSIQNDAPQRVEHASGLVIPRLLIGPYHLRREAMNGKAAPARPGWPEIVVGLVCLTVLAIGGGLGLVRLDLNPVVLGLILTALEATLQACTVNTGKRHGLRLDCLWSPSPLNSWLGDVCFRSAGKTSTASRRHAPNRTAMVSWLPLPEIWVR